MPSRKALKGQAPRLLGNHGGRAGKDYRRAWDTLAEGLGPFDSRLLRFEAGRAAVAMINLEAATRALATARTARERGRGRRPSAQQLERLQRRQALQDGTCGQVLDRLRELVAHRPAPSPGWTRPTP